MIFRITAKSVAQIIYSKVVGTDPMPVTLLWNRQFYQNCGSAKYLILPWY
jgi:hypothetical protein